MSTLQAQPRPKRIVGKWDKVIQESLHNIEQFEKNNLNHKNTAAALAREAAIEKSLRDKNALKCSEMIHNYWESVGGWKMLSETKDVDETGNYYEVVKTFEGCLIPEPLTDDPQTILKRIGGLTKNQIGEVVSSIESVKLIKEKGIDDCCIASELKSVIVMYESIPPLKRVLSNFNGDKLPVLIVMNDDVSPALITELMPFFSRHRVIVGLGDVTPETLGRVANAAADVIIITHNVLKQCLSQLAKRHFDLLIYQNEETSTSSYACHLTYESIILFTKSFDPCFPRHLTLLFPQQLPDTFWQRCDQSHLSYLSTLLSCCTLSINESAPATITSLPAPHHLIFKKLPISNTPPLLDIPNYPNSLIIDSPTPEKITTSIPDILLLPQKRFSFQPVSLPHVPTETLIDSLRRVESLQPLLNSLEDALKSEKPFAVVTKKVRFVVMLLKVLRVVKVTPVVVLKSLNDVGVFAAVHNTRGGCVIVNDVAVEGLRYFNVDKVILLQSSVGEEIKGILSDVNIIRIGQTPTPQQHHIATTSPQKKIDVFARNNYCSIEPTTVIPKQQLIDHILSSLLPLSPEIPPVISSSPVLNIPSTIDTDWDTTWDNDIEMIEKRISTNIEHLKRVEKHPVTRYLQSYKDKEFLKDYSSQFRLKQPKPSQIPSEETPNLLFDYVPPRYIRCTELKKLHIPQFITPTESLILYLNPSFLHFSHSDYLKRCNEILNKRTYKSKYPQPSSKTMSFQSKDQLRPHPQNITPQGMMRQYPQNLHYRGHPPMQASYGYPAHIPTGGYPLTANRGGMAPPHPIGAVGKNISHPQHYYPTARPAYPPPADKKR
ncbi:Uncharacterized protein QTN25_010243 [Entamoeba marina]